MPYKWIIRAIWLVGVLYWLASATGNKATVYRTNPTWRIVALIALFLMFVLFDAFPMYFYHHLYFPSEAIRWVGAAVCAFGVGFAIWARRTLGTNWSGNPTIKEGHVLIQAGPYRVVRHPIYTGILIGILGTGIGSGRSFNLYVLGFSTVGFWIKLKFEETLMLRQFPQAYGEYKKRTKALIPFIL
ncbi:MAG TPA: isoprenylcysteine carboxylmethyltransferase family protein [Opitutaceae bacterium]